MLFEGDRRHTYRRDELQISRSCLDNDRAQSKLYYLRDIAGINELKNDDGEVLLKKQYEKLTFVGEDSTLAAYLYPSQYRIKAFHTGPLNVICHQKVRLLIRDQEKLTEAEWDGMKDAMFAKYEIPLLRLPTNGSGEILKIKEILRPSVC